MRDDYILNFDDDPVLQELKRMLNDKKVKAKITRYSHSHSYYDVVDYYYAEAVGGKVINFCISHDVCAESQIFTIHDKIHSTTVDRAFSRHLKNIQVK